MESGKALVLGSIMKLDRPFRAATIGQMTGLERQLVRYHLVKFCEKGMLEKVNKTYIVTNKEELINSLLDTTDDVNIKRLTPKGLIIKSSNDHFVEMFTELVYLRQARAPESLEIKAFANQQIDDTIAWFKALKRMLNNSQPGKNRIRQAYGKFPDDHAEDIYKMLTEMGYMFTMNKDAWVENTVDLVLERDEIDED